VTQTRYIKANPLTRFTFSEFYEMTESFVLLQVRYVTLSALHFWEGCAHCVSFIPSFDVRLLSAVVSLCPVSVQ
jgi:hypothetical protein